MILFSRTKLLIEFLIFQRFVLSNELTEIELSSLINEHLIEEELNLVDKDIDNSKFIQIMNYLRSNMELKYNISTLNFSSNQIEYLDENSFAEFDHLAEIDFCKNKIKNITPDTFSNLKQLKIIYLNNNQLTEIHSNTFSQLDSLERIELGSNQIHKIKPYAFKTLPRLKKISFEVNNITNLDHDSFQEIPLLTDLVISSNSISNLKLKSFSNLPSLRELILNHNPIVKFDTEDSDDLLKLIDITIDNSNLTDDLNFTDLFLKIPNLTDLSLRNNSISKIDLNPLKNLIALSLDNNSFEEIKSIDITNCKKLEQFYLSDNLLKVVPSYAFNGLKSLKMIFLDDNFIENIFPSAFINLSGMKELDLSNNNLTFLPEDFLSSNMRDLNYLTLTDNNIELNPAGKIGLERLQEHFFEWGNMKFRARNYGDEPFIAVKKVYSNLKKEQLFWNFDVLKSLTDESVPPHKLSETELVAILTEMRNDDFVKEETFSLLENYIKKLFNFDYPYELKFYSRDEKKINLALDLLEYILKTLKTAYTAKKTYHEEKLMNDPNYERPKYIYDDCFPSMLTEISYRIRNDCYVAQLNELITSYSDLIHHAKQNRSNDDLDIEQGPSTSNAKSVDKEFENLKTFIKSKIAALKELKFKQLGDELKSNESVLILNHWKYLMKDEIGLVNIFDDNLFRTNRSEIDPLNNKPGNILNEFYKLFTIRDVCEIIKNELNEDGLENNLMRNKLIELIFDDDALEASQIDSMGVKVDESDPPGSYFNLITPKAIEYLLIKLNIICINVMHKEMKRAQKRRHSDD
jgi:Leucine-rich repeat (LRR) protein